MNERLKELAEQAGIGYLYEYEMKWAWLGELEVFAELVRQDEREAALAQPEQEPVCDKDPFYCLSIRCQAGKVCKHTAPPRKGWVGLTDDEIQDILDCNRGELIAIKKAEQRLKDKNTTHHLQHDE